jgi:hypothetical protein
MAYLPNVGSAAFNGLLGVYRTPVHAAFVPEVRDVAILPIRCRFPFSK